MKRVLCVLLAVCAFGAAAGCQEKQPEDDRLKESLLWATITAAETELHQLEVKLETAEADADAKDRAAGLKASIAALNREIARLKAMKPEEYPEGEGVMSPDRRGPLLPAVRREIAVTVKEGYGIGSLLDLDNSSRSGPFYRLAGIRGGCSCVLKRGRRYFLTVHLVFRREYFGFIEDSYVYVENYRER